MKISVVVPAELDEALRQRWLQFQAVQPLLSSPCFAPEFTLAAGQARRDVRVAIIEDAGEVAGFFPFQQRWGAGRPAGGRLSDHHGLIHHPQLDWDWRELLRACGLGYWQYDHLPACQRPPGSATYAVSPGLDLSEGFEAYRRRRLDAGARRLAELPRKARKLAREVGPLRFEVDSRDPAVLAWVMKLKSQQCRRTGAQDCFAPAWAREFVERIAAIDEPHFGGRLSVLYAGDRPVAAHFGMRSPHVWHWWFPVYSREHGAYSPGALLLMMLAEKVAAQGHRLLDLGKGDESYKASFADTGTALVEGCVMRASPVTSLRHARKRLGRWLRQSPLAFPVRPLLRQFGRLTACAPLVPWALAATDLS